MAERVEVTEEQFVRAWHLVYNCPPHEDGGLRVQRALNKVLNERWHLLPGSTAWITDGDFDISITSHRMDSDRPARAALANAIMTLLNENEIRRAE